MNEFDVLKALVKAVSSCDAQKKAKYMDWERAEQLCKDNPGATVYAGLKEDWNATRGMVFSKGKYCGEYVFTCSLWATPILDINGVQVECWKHSDTALSSGKPDWWGRGQKLLYDYKNGWMGGIMS